MWVEADTNITGGESSDPPVHPRQAFLPRGVRRRQPNCSGCRTCSATRGALPQIMRGCGIQYFSTAKIFWNYHGGDRSRYNTFCGKASTAPAS